MPVFVGGAQLNKHISFVVVEPDVGGTVKMSFPVDDGTRGGVNDLIPVIYDVKDVFHTKVKQKERKVTKKK
jgi:hypothetical protein